MTTRRLALEIEGWRVDGEEVKAAAAEAGGEVEEAGKVVVGNLWVDEGAQAVVSNALWSLRTGTWGHLLTASSSVNCYLTTKLQPLAVLAMLLPIAGLSLKILS